MPRVAVSSHHLLEKIGFQLGILGEDDIVVERRVVPVCDAFHRLAVAERGWSHDGAVVSRSVSNNCSTTATFAQPRLSSHDEHAVAVAVEPIPFPNRFLVRAEDEV